MTLSNFIKYNTLLKAANKFDYDKYLSSSYNYSRSQMPQIDYEHFDDVINSLIAKFNVKHVSKNITKLKPTQHELNVTKIKNKLCNSTFNTSALKFICANDMHIVDSHHAHVAALIKDDSIQADCYIVDCDIHKLLAFLNKLPKTYKQTI